LAEEPVQAAMGFEPMNNGFAIRPLGPLGYAADESSRIRGSFTGVKAGPEPDAR
jgi:hypothetical protein